MHIKNKKGQSTVEYILLVTAVVAVMIVFATNKSGGLQGKLNTTLNTVVDDMGTAVDTLTASHSATNAVNGATENLYNVDVIPH